MTDLVVWTGPVAAFQVPGATLPGAKTVFFGCRGDVNPKFPWCPGIGRAIDSSPSLLLKKAGVKSVDDLYLAAFSAGGSIVKRVLMNPEYRKLTTGVHLADATYTAAWVDAKKRLPPADKGFVEYAVDVASGPGDKLFIATASPIPNKKWASGIENLRAIRWAVEERLATPFRKRADFFGIEPGPDKVYQLGNVIFAEYPLKPIGHSHPKIAPQVWKNIIQPWVAKGKGPIDAPAPLPKPADKRFPGEMPAAASWWPLALGVGLGYVLVRVVRGR